MPEDELAEMREERSVARTAFRRSRRRGDHASAEEAARWYRAVESEIAERKGCVGGDAR